MIGRDHLRLAGGRTLQVLLFFAALAPMLVESGGIAVSANAIPWLRAGSVLFAALLAFDEVRRLRSAVDRGSHVREEAVDIGLLALVVLVILEEWVTGGYLLGMQGSQALVIPAKGYILVNLVLRVVRLFRYLVRSRASYPKVFVLSFFAVIAAGTVLLWAFPGAAQPGRHIGFLNALFTSVSATCVTGLTVLDTSKDFSRFGQVVILILIQIGGLGLMTFAAFFAMALGKGMGFSDRLVLRDMMNVDPLSTLGRLLAGIVGLTFVLEGAGALLMFGKFPDPNVPGLMLDAPDQAFYAVFHSVSAFCNAGFTLYDSANWTPFVGNPLMSGVIIAQIILGGLGFTVLLNLIGLNSNLVHALRRRLRRRPMTEEEEEREERHEPARVSLQTRLVLRFTAVLIGAGAVLFWLFERQGVLAEHGVGTSALASVFQSVTTRTAGFNTVSIEALQPATLFMFCLLMFIGASPGGTGGGIKTVTAVVMVRTISTLARGRTRVEMHRRSLPQVVIYQAVVVTTLSMLAVSLGTLLLTLTEGALLGVHEGESATRFLGLLFEAVSAFATVGLSTGITPQLSVMGKIIIIGLMFVGRIGPLTLTLAVANRRAAAYEFPEERVMIG
jgi:trk system potassium uptake protein TrkH